MNTTQTLITASEKQIAFARKLMTERDYSSLQVANIHDRIENGPFTKVDASTLISLLLGCPRVQSEKPAVAEGFYLLEEKVFKVVASKGSGNLYAKVLVIPAEGGKGRFEYAPGAIKNLAGAEKLTVQEAANMGHAHGMCMVCGALLTDPGSVSAGIGPVCAAKL